MGLSLLPSTNVRPTFHPNSLNVMKAFRFAMSLTFFYVKIHCVATGCDACHFPLSQQKRKRYQIIGQYVANNFTHRTAQITMSQLLRLKKKYIFQQLQNPSIGCVQRRSPYFSGVFCFVFPRGFFVLATIQVRGLEENVYSSLCGKDKKWFSLFF